MDSISRAAKIAAIILALAALLLGGTGMVDADEVAHWKSSAYVVDAFVEIALRREHSTRQGPVRKWVSPVSYFIVNGVGEEELHEQLIRTHFEHLAAVTGLPIRPAASQAAANYLIVLTSEEKLQADMAVYFGQRLGRQRENLFQEHLCAVAFASDRKGAIVHAVAMIPVDSATARGQLASCVAEELTHAMGLPNDSPRDLPSIFSRKYYQVFLSGLDLLLLEMLYDPRVEPGMDERTVRPILREIAGEYARDNRFDSIEALAAEGGLAGLSLRAGCR